MNPDRRSLPSASFMIAAWSRVVSPAQRTPCLTVASVLVCEQSFAAAKTYSSPSSGIRDHRQKILICFLSRTPL